MPPVSVQLSEGSEPIRRLGCRGDDRLRHALAGSAISISMFTSCATETIGLTQDSDGEPLEMPTMTASALTQSESGIPREELTANQPQSVPPVVNDDLIVPSPASVDAGADTDRCAKIDLLYIVDNSQSMLGEQDNLIRSFPAFADLVQGVLGNRDYQIMVVDTDASGVPSIEGLADLIVGNVTCDPAPSCCGDVCVLASLPFTASVVSSCNGTLCADYSQADLSADSCEGVLGAGRRLSVEGEPCGIADSRRYMLADQPDLAETFSCAARVGTAGDGQEQPIGALLSALSDFHNEGDGCNAGFLRDDAVLVVTIITDEEDRQSGGGPEEWRQAVLDAKGGNEDAVVLLGLIPEKDDSERGFSQGAALNDSAPRLRPFIESFRFGSVGSIDSQDYTPFFEAAVTGIETSCREFRGVAR